MCRYKLPDTTAEDFLLGGMPRKEEALKKAAAKQAAAKKAKAAADGAAVTISPMPSYGASFCPACEQMPAACCRRAR